MEQFLCLALIHGQELLMKADGHSKLPRFAKLNRSKGDFTSSATPLCELTWAERSFCCRPQQFWGAEQQTLQRLVRRAADAAGHSGALAALGSRAGRALPRAPLALPARHAAVPLHRRSRLPAQPQAAVTALAPPRDHSSRALACHLDAAWPRSGDDGART